MRKDSTESQDHVDTTIPYADTAKAALTLTLGGTTTINPTNVPVAASHVATMTIPKRTRTNEKAPKYKPYSMSWLYLMAQQGKLVTVLKRNKNGKSTYGWLRLTDNPKAKPGKHLTPVEWGKAMYLVSAALPYHSAFALVAHAWGLTTHTLKKHHKKRNSSEMTRSAPKTLPDTGGSKSIFVNAPHYNAAPARNSKVAAVLDTDKPQFDENLQVHENHDGEEANPGTESNNVRENGEGCNQWGHSHHDGSLNDESTTPGEEAATDEAAPEETAPDEPVPDDESTPDDEPAPEDAPSSAPGASKPLPSWRDSLYALEEEVGLENHSGSIVNRLRRLEEFGFGGVYTNMSIDEQIAQLRSAVGL
eukprot:scaffold4786_cov198-Amphora_coffeaeformis.AAC.5